MNLQVCRGDLLDAVADVLICTANPTLGMTGRVNGALFSRGGEGVQAELKQYLASRHIKYVEAGTVVRTGPGPLAVKHILHAVGVNMFYESSVELISRLLTTALKESSALGARTVATPALATGYGPLSMSECAAALTQAAKGSLPGIEELRVILRRSEDVDEVTVIVEGVRSGARDS
jgi:O-acetyl-ADP-ribose deacetylase